MTSGPDDELYRRGAATLLASWEAYARGSEGAALHRLSGVAAAVFPTAPERDVYNNALLDRDLGAAERTAAVEAMRSAYAAAGVERYAAWVHESDEGMRAELARRGYSVAETTRAMGLALAGLAIPAPEADVTRTDWPEYLRILPAHGAPRGILSGADPSGFHVLVARLDGESVATALAFDHRGDCGVFNVSTLAFARRRGLGSAITARLLHDAVARGCATASLQSTPVAERVYAGAGFRDLGMFLEYVP